MNERVPSNKRSEKKQTLRCLYITVIYGKSSGGKGKDRVCSFAPKARYHLSLKEYKSSFRVQTKVST